MTHTFNAPYTPPEDPLHTGSVTGGDYTPPPYTPPTGGDTYGLEHIGATPTPPHMKALIQALHHIAATLERIEQRIGALTTATTQPATTATTQPHNACPICGGGDVTTIESMGEGPHWWCMACNHTWDVGEQGA